MFHPRLRLANLLVATPDRFPSRIPALRHGIVPLQPIKTLEPKRSSGACSECASKEHQQ